MKKQSLEKNKLRCACGSYAFEYVEDFDGTVTNPILNGVICFNVKNLDGETNDPRIVCSKCGKELDKDKATKIIGFSS